MGDYLWESCSELSHNAPMRGPPGGCLTGPPCPPYVSSELFPPVLLGGYPQVGVGCPLVFGVFHSLFFVCYLIVTVCPLKRAFYQAPSIYR